MLQPRLTVGDTVGRWTLLERLPGGKVTPARWECQCSCGKMGSVVAWTLEQGCSKSCGCLRGDLLGVKSTTHGWSGHPLFSTWSRMLDRCRNTGNNKFQDYGGRGITVHPRWDDFDVFVRDVGMPGDPGYTLERVNNDGNYEPSNCVWASRKSQTRNRRVTWFADAWGARKPVAQWAEEYGIRYGTIQSRLRRGGMTMEQALTTPVQKRTKKGVCIDATLAV